MKNASTQLLNTFGIQHWSSPSKYHINDTPLPLNRAVPTSRIICTTDMFNQAHCFFTSRGASELYADTMAALAIETAKYIGVSIQTLLSSISHSDKLKLDTNSRDAMNKLRNAGNQVGRVTTASNRDSIQHRSIRG